MLVDPSLVSIPMAARGDRLPFMPANKRSGVPQADELVRAARVPVFLLDEYQGVPALRGRNGRERIKEACARNGTVVRRGRPETRPELGCCSALTDGIRRTVRA